MQKDIFMRHQCDHFLDLFFIAKEVLLSNGIVLKVFFNNVNGSSDIKHKESSTQKQKTQFGCLIHTELFTSETKTYSYVENSINVMTKSMTIKLSKIIFPTKQATLKPFFCDPWPPYSMVCSQCNRLVIFGHVWQDVFSIQRCLGLFPSFCVFNTHFWWTSIYSPNLHSVGSRSSSLIHPKARSLLFSPPIPCWNGQHLWCATWNHVSCTVTAHPLECVPQEMGQ